MTSIARISILSGSDVHWPGEVERLRGLLGAPENPTLFPPHFLKATFPRLGGRIALIGPPAEPNVVAFLFPGTPSNGRPSFTMRAHSIGEAPQLSASVLDQISALLDNAAIVPFDTLSRKTGIESVPTRTEVVSTAGPDNVSISRPQAHEAALVRELQRQIWNPETDYLYPVDIHDVAFSLGNSLIARVDNQPVGFLFGFHKLGGPQLPSVIAQRHRATHRIESQLMGVLNEHRARRIAFRLKAAQARDALEQGISVINWTVDPLLYPNAVLNFGRLRAVAFNYYPDFYDFRNDLNRVPASRLGITWLVESDRVRSALASPAEPVIDLDGRLDIAHANRETSRLPLSPSVTLIAIEIPEDWQSLQNTDIDRAMAWRATTDAIFAENLGHRDGDFGIHAVGRLGTRRFLIAERVSPALAEQLAM